MLGTLRMDLPGYQGKLRRKEGHFLTLSPYLMAESLKKHVDQIRNRTVNVPNVDVDDFLPTPVIESPSSATTTPALAAPTLQRSTRVSNPSEYYSPGNYA